MSGNAKSLMYVMRGCVAARQVSVSRVISAQSRSVSDQSRSVSAQSRSVADLGSGISIRPARYHNRWTAAPTPSLAGLSLRAHQDLNQRGLCSKTGTPQKEDVYPPLPDYSEPETQTREVYPPLPACPDPETQTREVYPPPPGYPDPETQTRRFVRARGLPWSCTEEDLLHFFSECRVRDGVKGVHLLLHQAGRPSGQAVIEMEHEEDVRKAVEKHCQYLGPRYIEVYEMADSDAEAILSSGQQPGQDGLVRIRGLPYSCTEADIHTFFSGLDVVNNGVTMVTNHRGRRFGEAFVQFTSREAAVEALQRDGAMMGNRYIEVFASQRSEMLLSCQPWTPSAARAGLRPPLNTNPPPRRNGPTYTGPGRHPANESAQHCVHMRGLPFNTTAQDIMEFFSPLEPSTVLIEYDSNGRLSGEAKALFSCHEDATAAMGRDKAYMQRRYIELFLNSAPKRLR